MRLFILLAIALAGPVHAQHLTVDPKLAAQGRGLFQRRGCAACHAIGKKGQMAGPDLAGVTDKRSLAWLRRLLKSPEQMATSDSLTRSLIRAYKGTKMPDAKLTDAEVEALLHYLAQASHT